MERSGWDGMPEHAALLQLDRLLLEESTQAVRRYVSEQRDKDPTGEQVPRQGVHLRERADTCLLRGQQALDVRHSVLHATPLVLLQLPGTTPVPDSWLLDGPGSPRRA